MPSRTLACCTRQVAGKYCRKAGTERGLYSAPYSKRAENQLLGRAHNLIYMGHRPKISELRKFYSETYPQVFRETFPQTMLAFGIFLVTALAAFALTLHAPSFAHRMLGAQMMDTIEKREMWTHSIVTVKPLAASAIMTNNLSVSSAPFWI